MTTTHWPLKLLPRSDIRSCCSHLIGEDRPHVHAQGGQGQEVQSYLVSGRRRAGIILLNGTRQSSGTTGERGQQSGNLSR